MNPNQILKQYFGYDEFREGQSELVDALMQSRDALGIMPTGAGKSLCYQIPAMLLPGVTLVISPLISLMRDQVQALVANGIPAAFLNSSLTETQYNKAIASARSGQYKIIYIAPERLLSLSILEFVQSIQISLIAVDEAHCISQWGQDFRPSYLDIPKFVESLPTRPVMAAFTATATHRVRKDILSALRLINPLTMVTGFDRPNLYFEVKQPKEKFAVLKQYLKKNDNNGIVYCSTRNEVEGVTKKLIADGYSAAQYHAGLSDVERSRSQDDFLYNRVKIIVATNAFGMGIDKPDVRFVIHYNMPQNVESYYQEAGRAGRDGLPADCILFYARKDINTALFLINRSENPDEIIRNKQLLNKMEKYCETDACLRRYLLEYFGEQIWHDCGNCGSCNGNLNETDVTIDAQKVLSHISRLNKAGKRFMFTHTADILLGKSDDFTDLSTFGIMKGAPRKYIRQLTNRLTALGYILDNGYLSITPKANEVLLGVVGVAIHGNKPKSSAKKERIKKQIEDSAKYVFSEELFDKLKGLRHAIAREENVPAYVVFSDATLIDMCQKHPYSLGEMVSVSGVGQVKLKRYGERFLQLFQTEQRNAALKDKKVELTMEMFMHEVDIVDKPLQISRIAENINAVLLKYDKPRTSGIKLNNFLMEAGYLEATNDGKTPTKIGREHGITSIRRNSERGEYMQSVFNAEAQRICVRLLLDSQLMNAI